MQGKAWLNAYEELTSCLRMVAVFALRRVFETIGLIFVRARFERSKILLNQYREVDFAIYLLHMFQSDLLRMRPSSC